MKSIFQFFERPIKVAGMGAIPHAKGTHFRVWAPHAKKVCVFGSFNNWNERKASVLRYEDKGFWGGNIRNVKPGDEYRYIIVTQDGRHLMRNDPYARVVTNSVGNSIVYDPNTFQWGDTDFKMKSWNELVIYEMHIGTFYAPEAGKPGDFYTAIKKLPYLKQLGINAIEIMPAAEFAGDYSWGYNPAHPFTVESTYGGPNAFKTFVNTCHQHDIAVILDVVYNHFGPSDLDLWQFDGWSENNKGGIYFYNDWRSTTPWGDTRPDYGRWEVRQYIRDNAMMWLEEYHCDGLRMDMTPYIRNVYADENPANDLKEGFEMIQWINKEIATRYPSKITIAEDLHGMDFITAKTEDGGCGYGSQWDADFVHPVREVLKTVYDGDRDMEKIRHALMRRYNHDIFQRIIYTESHDEVSNGKARLPEEISNGNVNNYYAKKRTTLGAAMVLTAPGIPMLFQGQAILEDKWFSDTDPIEWERLKEFSGINMLFSDLIHLRINATSQTKGLTGQNTSILHLDYNEKIIAFHRWEEGGVADSTVVILNFQDKPHDAYAIPFPLPGKWDLLFNSDWECYDKDFTGHPVSDVEVRNDKVGKVAIGAYAALIYALLPSS